MLAVFYALFGVSQASAVFVNALFYGALLAGVYRLAIRYLDRPTALVAACFVGAAPEIAFWGRQIMTDVPAAAASVWAAEMFLAYIVSQRTRDLYMAALMAAIAVWLKITTCFLLPVWAVGIVLIDGRQVWRRRRNWWVVAGMSLALLPLLWLTLNFGQTNVHSVAGVADSATSRASIGNWLWYARRMPQQLGWPISIALLIGLILGGVRLVRHRRVPGHWIFLIAWAVVGYLFFSAIDLKHSRFIIPVLVPLVLIGVWGVRRVFGTRRYVAYAVLTGSALVTLVVTLVYRPPLYVSGYAAIVKNITRRAPKNSNIVFSGYRDGAFIFAMRAIGHRPDLRVIRADKLLLSVAIRRSTGVKEKHLTRAQIAKEVTHLKAAYVVAQNGFWTDLTEMRRLQQVLYSNQFTPVARYRLQSNFNAPDQTITVYHNNAKLPAKRPARSIGLPAIGRTVSKNPG